ncbi:hypothetical protein V1478_014140 [Vespula squamosa]|uniref:Uncharacterized protein n=1 Tax=Vespula squamosa TaxID=30214 RepID=A0ABD2A768_VESSQ
MMNVNKGNMTKKYAVGGAAIPPRTDNSAAGYLFAMCNDIAQISQHRLLLHNSIAIVPHSTTQDLLYYILQMTIVP